MFLFRRCVIFFLRARYIIAAHLLWKRDASFPFEANVSMTLRSRDSLEFTKLRLQSLKRNTQTARASEQILNCRLKSFRLVDSIPSSSTAETRVYVYASMTRVGSRRENRVRTGHTRIIPSGCVSHLSGLLYVQLTFERNGETRTVFAVVVIAPCQTVPPPLF